MPTRAFNEQSAAKSLSPAARKRAVRAAVAQAEQMHKEDAALPRAIANDTPVLADARGPDLVPAASARANPNDAGNWIYDGERGRYLNRLTGEIAEEPDTDIPAAAALGEEEIAEQEEGFTVPEAQYRMGVRLAVSKMSGLVRRCPMCGKRRLLTVPKDGAAFLVCADAMTDGGACDFYRKV